MHAVLHHTVANPKSPILLLLIEILPYLKDPKPMGILVHPLL